MVILPPSHIPNQGQHTPDFPERTVLWHPQWQSFTRILGRALRNTVFEKSQGKPHSCELFHFPFDFKAVNFKTKERKSLSDRIKF